MIFALALCLLLSLGYLSYTLHRRSLNKANLISYYLRHLVYFIPGVSLYLPVRFERKLRKLSEYSRGREEMISTRVDYYNRLSGPYRLPLEESPQTSYWPDFRKRLRKSTSRYNLDFAPIAFRFNDRKRVSINFGDDSTIQERPTLIKTRKIAADNRNNVLLKLGKARHFNFVTDCGKFQRKRDQLVWRGAAYQDHRKRLLREHTRHPLLNIGSVVPVDGIDHCVKPPMTIREQLAYKYILSIEGNDVASNLKWIMSSNSLVFMTRPRIESWFMEGTLQPGVHYVELREDYQDLLEKIDYCNQNPDHCLEMIDAAHAHIDQFRDSKIEEYIGFLVLKKYFDLQVLEP